MLVIVHAMREVNRTQFSKPFTFTPKILAVISLIPIISNVDLFFRQVAWSDDFAMRGDSLISGGRETFLQITANLRPLFALFLKATFTKIVYEENILILQLFSLIGMILLNIILLKILRDREFSQKFAVTLIFIANCLPSFQQYTHFATISIFTWVCAGSAIAYHLIPKSKYAFWPFLLILAGMLIYPPAALFGLTLISIDLAQEVILGKSIFTSAFRTKLQKIFLVYATGSLSGLLFAYTFGYLLDVQFAERTKLITSIPILLEKIQWVISYLFITSIRPLAIGAGDNIIITFQVLPVLLLIAITTMSFRNLRQQVTILALFIFPLVSSLSNIVIAENQFEFRTLPGLCFGGLFACLFLIKLQIQRLPTKFSPRITHSILGLVLSVILVNSHWNSYELWAAPGNVRQEVIAKNISNLTENVCLYLPNESLKPLARLGIYSMRSDLQSSWVTNNIFAFIPSVARSTKTYVVNERENCGVNDQMIDFSQLSKLPFRKFVW